MPGRVLYRLAEPGEVVPAVGPILTLLSLEDVYMEVFLSAREAGLLPIGAEARIAVDALPDYAISAAVSFVSPEAQFTPKQVETLSEREQLVFRVRVRIPQGRFKGETVEGYAAGLHESFLQNAAREAGVKPVDLARIEPRFRYNQSFESIAAIAPAMPAILLAWLPAVLTAVSLARERELGSITNFYVTPTTRLEFLIGKQLPYIAIAFVNFLMLTAMILLIFGVPLKGDPVPLALGAFLFVWASTSFGLLIATMTSSQVAAVFATTIVSIIPTVQFSGLMQPVSTLEPGAQVVGSLWHASHFLHLSGRGAGGTSSCGRSCPPA